MIVAVASGERDLVVRSDRADDGRAQMFGPLAGDQTHATRGRMEKDRLALFHRIGALQKILRGHAFEQ